MGFSVAPLLMASESVPAVAHSALRAAYNKPISEQQPRLETAARILHRELDLDCSDARELVGLTSGEACC